MRGDKRAVSPAFLMVIIISVVLAIAIAASFWVLGVTNQHPRFERVEVIPTHCEYINNLTAVNNTVWTEEIGGWKITLELRNTGMTEVTIDNVFINSREIDEYGHSFITVWQVYGREQVFVPWREKMTCASGKSDSIYIVMRDGAGITFAPGKYIEVALQTGAGNTFRKTFTLS